MELFYFIALLYRLLLETNNIYSTKDKATNQFIYKLKPPMQLHHYLLQFPDSLKVTPNQQTTKYPY